MLYQFQNNYDVLIINIQTQQHQLPKTMLQSHQDDQTELTTIKKQDNLNQPSPILLKGPYFYNLALRNNHPNVFYRAQTNPDSQSQDSAVSFEQNILEQHLKVSHFEIQTLTNILVRIISFDLLLICRQPEPYIERPSLKDYLQQTMSLLKRQEVPFFMSLLSMHQNSNKFLQDVFQGSSQLLVHEIVFISYQTFKNFRPVQGLFYSISQLRQLSRNPRFIKIICDHAELNFLSYHHIFGKQGRYQDQIRQKVVEFLHCYVLTCLLVIENYFANPYYQKLERKRKQERIKKNRIRFNRRTTNKDKKITKDCCIK